VTGTNDVAGGLAYCERARVHRKVLPPMNVSILLLGVALILGSLLAATYALFR
jgi:hypothetical protein